MRITYKHDEFLRAGFLAQTEEQDGTPRIDWLYTSLAPTWFSGNRRALACALSNITYVSGKLSVDQEFSPLTANLVRNLLPSTEVFINTSNINFKPTDMQRGGSTLHVKALNSIEDADRFQKLVNEIDGGSRQTCLVILKNDGVKGFLGTPNSRIVSSNFWLVQELSSAKQQICSLAALALMYSEDLSVAKVVLHTPLSVPPETIRVLRESFYSVGIALEILNGS